MAVCTAVLIGSYVQFVFLDNWGRETWHNKKQGENHTLEVGFVFLTINPGGEVKKLLTQLALHLLLSEWQMCLVGSCSILNSFDDCLQVVLNTL